MAEKLLTDRACKTAKPADGMYKNDGNGLRLKLEHNGTKYWMLRYTLDGRESTFLLGSYPDVSLDEARKRASDARNLVAEGIRPTVERKTRVARNIAKGEATFQVVAEEWLAMNKATWSGHHYERNEGLLRRILYPKLGRLPVTEITEQILLQELRVAYDSGIKESARRARAVAQQVFQHAKDTHRATHNPARELAGSTLLKKPTVKHFAALKAADVGSMMRKLEQSAFQPVTKAALIVNPVTGLRDEAMRAGKWGEIDLDEAIWTVPPERMKSGRTHRVPLPRQAVKALTNLARITNRGPDSFVFASTGKEGYLAENTLRLALHRLGFKVTVHGFRSLLTDVLNEQGFNPDAIELQLDHVNKDRVRAAYLRSDFFEYRRPMMQWFADWIDAQVAEKSAPRLPANVVRLRQVA